MKRKLLHFLGEEQLNPTARSKKDHFLKYRIFLRYVSILIKFLVEIWTDYKYFLHYVDKIGWKRWYFVKSTDVKKLVISTDIQKKFHPSWVISQTYTIIQKVVIFFDPRVGRYCYLQNAINFGKKAVYHSNYTMLTRIQ